MTTQSNQQVIALANLTLNMVATRVQDFIWINPSVLFGSKSENDP